MKTLEGRKATTKTEAQVAHRKNTDDTKAACIRALMASNDASQGTWQGYGQMRSAVMEFVQWHGAY